MPVTMICEECGVTFGVKPSRAARGNTRYCSHTCKGMAQRTLPDATCQYCGKIYRAFAKGAGDTFCSATCFTAYRRSLPPEQRAALMHNATAVIRGSKRGHDDLCKRARTKQDRATLSDDEREILDALHAADLTPVPHYAFDKYNIDFAFPAAMVAIEYQGGNWHNTPLKREQDERKAVFLRDAGWTLLTFPRLDKPQANSAGNRRIAVDEIVRQTVDALHDAIPRLEG